MKKIFYKLRLDGEYLVLEGHGDGTQILQLSWGSPTLFSSEEEAIRAICDNFYFHHGCGSISAESSAKERLEKIELIKVIIVEDEELIKPTIYIPTNLELHQFYILAKGDTGLEIYLESAYPEFKGRKDKYKDDGYEFAGGDYLRLKEYNEWLAKGKPINEKKAKISYVKAAIDKWCKGII